MELVILSKPTENAQFILCKDDQLVLPMGKPVSPVYYADIRKLCLEKDSLVALNGQQEVFCANVIDSQVELESQGFHLTGLRSILDEVRPEIFELFGQAWQLQHAKHSHKYCGKCGRTNLLVEYSALMRCLHCKLEYYPRISPCIIVLITDEDRCLLARHTYSTQDIYTALAGFVEPGESLEQTLIREVHEEVDLEVDNIRYFNSQSWPFPGQQMAAFTASYRSGTIKICEDEIMDANWYDKHNLPSIPSPMTLSGQLIRHFINH